MKEKKTITLTLVGTGKPQTEDIGIVKGTSPEDLKRVSKILEKDSNYTFQRRATGEILNKGVDIFGILEDHEKVNASPEATLGGLREAIASLFSFSDAKDNKIPIAYPSYDYFSRDVPIIEAIPIEQLGLDAQLAELGWSSSQNGYEGQIFVNGNHFPANLTKSWSGYRLFIYSSSPSNFRGRHQHCFIHQRDGWYFVHFIKGENSPLSMIQTAKGYIAESGGAL